ncbi:Hypothetical predicted protein [Paramuricea clavata]|uniref:Uncharacterized protein n=1 Tax=Paramuricea clavata TaxID=317549 RepID=A0A7D9I489_PARCT|nr:Hypothetical predicted protein [Paramuricea clavata]
MECGYARYVGGPCGGSQQSPHTRQCLRIADCSKDIRDYLGFLKVGDPSITSEASLLLARAGLFGPEENHGNITICPRHRDSHGIRWRCNRRNCVCPASWAVHGSVKAERPITKEQSEKLLNLTHVLVPVGSGIGTTYRKRLTAESKRAEQSVGSRNTCRKCPQDVLDLCDSFLNLSIEERDHSASMFVPEEPTSSSTT